MHHFMQERPQPGPDWLMNRSVHAIGRVLFGVDVGHSKCCIACGEADPRGFISLIGIGERQFGPEMRDPFNQPDQLIQILHELICEFENRHEVSLGAAEVAVSETHLRGETFSEGAETSIPATHEFLHRFGRWQDEAPWWRFRGGHGIHGPRAALAKIVRVVEQVPLRPQHLVFSGLASAYAVSRPQERWGADAADVLTIDIGAAMTEYFLFADANVSKSGVIPVGGDRITSEIATKMKLSWQEAEKQKVTNGTVSPQSEIIWQHIINMLTNVAEHVAVRPRKFSVVYLTGGTSRTHNIEKIAASIFDRPVYLASATNLAGATNAAPEHSTVLGLLKYSYNAAGKCKMLHETVRL